MAFRRINKTDWSKCCLCQEETGEALRKPTKDHIDLNRSGYRTLANNIPIFHSLNSNPIPINPQRLNDGSGIEETLRDNDAIYHDTCRLKFNNTKLEREQKKADAQKRKLHQKKRDDIDGSRAKRFHIDKDQLICFICEKEDTKSNLSRIETPQTRQNLKDMATELNDVKLMKSVCDDPIAKELKYHPKCLTGIHNRIRSLRKTFEQEKDEQLLINKDAYPVAFSELVAFIHESKLKSDTQATVFRLAELTNLYSQRLLQLGVQQPSVNSSRLKTRLLHHIPGLEAYTKGRDVLLAFKGDVGPVLANSTEYDDAIIVGMAARILRKQIMQFKSSFQGNFDADYVDNCVPQQLLQFVASISHGTDIKTLVEFGTSKADIAISHLLLFNCHKTYKQSAMFHRHSAEREPAFPVYMGLSIYSKTRKEQLVNTLYEYGLSVSYDRVLQISNLLGEAVVSRYAESGVVYPQKLMKGIFTISAVDNIDHNPSATTAKSSFHGTSISLFQHQARNGTPQEKLTFKKNINKIPNLPETFTNIKPTLLGATKPLPNRLSLSILSQPLNLHLKHEYEWLENVHLTEVFDQSLKITWSAYHAAQVRNHDFEVCISALLPLLRDQAHDIATIKHVMDKVKETIVYLNPSQTPVITADQPLFALAKQIQWAWPTEYGNYVVMFGDLHVEMAALKMIGNILQRSGWVVAIEESGVASHGIADSLLSVTNIAKARRAHQITACALYNMMTAAFEKDNRDHPEDVTNIFEEWRLSRCVTQPCFRYWDMVLEIELLILSFIRSLREGNFDEYKRTLTNIMPHFFSNDNIHYSRWLTIHLDDMITLKNSHPDVEQEFQSGRFVVYKSDRAFSGIGIDQAHEQNNALIKGDGGVIGITENPSALLRWMVAGPELSHLVQDYETSSEAKQKVKTKHHEDTPSAQQRFFNEVKDLTSCFDELGNPFIEESNQLLTLDSKEISETCSLDKWKQTGLEQFKKFRENPSKFYEPIKKKKFQLFEVKNKSMHKNKQSSLKQDCTLFSNLFITCQNRKLDLNVFFKYENQPFPPSISNNGGLNMTQKSDLIHLLEELIQVESTVPVDVDALFIDGSSLVHCLRPSENTFQEYANICFAGKITTLANKHKRVDVIFDQYKPDSLKSSARASRGNGCRRKVTKSGRIPRNWPNFLQNDENKKELFPLLAESLKNVQCGLVYATKDNSTVCNQSNRSHIPCTHEEADTKIFVHLKHAIKEDSVKTACILSNDTDIVVIAVSFFNELISVGLQQLWVAFGSSKKRRWLPIHDIVKNLGNSKSKGLLFFHSFSGCDNVSAFKGKGKKSFLQSWNIFPEITESFARLSRCPNSINKKDIQLLERFVILLYDRSSALTNVDDARKNLFMQKNRHYDALPPTRAALLQHIYRSTYQAGYIWGQSLVQNPMLPSPGSWGWIKNDEGTWNVHWTNLAPVSEICRELCKCACKLPCSGKCTCCKSNLPCTSACSCPCGVNI